MKLRDHLASALILSGLYRRLGALWLAGLRLIATFVESGFILVAFMILKIGRT
jgi:hypothetical protein